MQALSGLLEPLDYPRQALYNVFDRGHKLLSGEGDVGDNLLGMLPGIAGLGAGALAATGVGIPAALLYGSVVGGLGQGAGKALDTRRDNEAAVRGDVAPQHRFDAARPEDLIEQLGGDRDSWLQSTLAGMATDPLTFAGGIGGGARGAKVGAELGASAGAKYGGRLEAIANHMGPMYPGGAEKLREMVSGISHPGLQEQIGKRVEDVLARPDASRILGEIEPGSQFIGRGVESTVVGKPGKGTVTSLSDPWEAVSKYGRPDVAGSLTTRPSLPEVNQAVRSLPLGGGDYFYRVEHSPRLQTVAEAAPFDALASTADQTARQAAKGEYRTATQDLLESLMANGFDNADTANIINNIGKTPEGRFSFIDPGGIRSQNPLTNPLPHAAEMATNPGTSLERALLQMMGSHRQIRRELQAGSSPFLTRRPLHNPDALTVDLLRS
jgi:hypothetical protein